MAPRVLDYLQPPVSDNAQSETWFLYADESDIKNTNYHVSDTKTNINKHVREQGL